MQSGQVILFSEIVRSRTKVSESNGLHLPERSHVGPSSALILLWRGVVLCPWLQASGRSVLGGTTLVFVTQPLCLGTLLYTGAGSTSAAEKDRPGGPTALLGMPMSAVTSDEDAAPSRTLQQACWTRKLGCCAPGVTGLPGSAQLAWSLRAKVAKSDFMSNSVVLS